MVIATAPLLLGLLTAAGSAAPSVATFSPTKAPTGGTVTVTGHGFADAGGVRFGGRDAAFRIVSDSRIEATVPSGAASGPIQVETPGATLQSPGSFDYVPPNIVFILTDDQRFDELDHMPFVQSDLIGDGVQFTDGLISDPLCCPSRATILTGTYSHTNGIYTNVNSTGGFGRFRDKTTIATVLHAQGYDTGLIGKYLNGYQPKNAAYIPPGWDRWFALTTLKYLNFTVSDQGKETQYASKKNYLTDILGQQAVNFVNSAPTGKPLFLYWAPYAPHGGAVPAKKYAHTFDNLPPLRPPNYNEQDVSDKPAYVRAIPPWTQAQMAEGDVFRQRQYACLLSVDDWVKAIVNALSATGRLSNTLFVYLGDNGHPIGEHRLDTPDDPHEKLSPYMESLKVPFIVRWSAAGWTVPRVDGQHIVSNVDVAQTMASAAGTTMPGNEGLNMLPLLADPTTPWRTELLIEHGVDQRYVPAYCGVVTSGFEYTQYSTGEEELYDLTNDPYELRNAENDPAYASVLTQLRTDDHTLCHPVPPGFSWSH